MQCKHHPDRKADFFCASCNAPLCKDCAEEVRTGVYTCFQCGMLQSISQVGNKLGAKRERVKQQKGKRKAWGPFRYFVLLSCVWVGVMWGVIFFGGKPAPERNAEFAKEGRVLLFMVHGALTRYAHYNQKEYPETLADLSPKYIPLKGGELSFLNALSYEKDPEVGYRLSLAHPKDASMQVVLTPGGVEYQASKDGGA